jgi:signal transduction histidine kinase
MRIPARLRARSDLVAAVSLAGFALLALSDDAGADRATDGTAVLLVLLGTLPVALRPRAPLAVLAVISAAIMAALAAGYAAGAASLSLAWMFGHIAATRSTRVAMAACGTSALAVLAGPLAARGRLNAGEVVGGLVLFSLPWLVGDRVRARREAAAAASRAERERIARDLHDTVAHALTAVAVQADAGDALLDRDPERARAALAAIRATAREALGDVRQVVAHLRMEDEPGVEAIPLLVAAARRGGLQVDLIDRRPAVVPAAVSAAAYRIVQEALTNVARHAEAGAVRVSLSDDDGDLLVSVEDDGRGSADEAVHGHGLAGMRERVELCGGSLRTGASAEGGFAVAARLPLGVRG